MYMRDPDEDRALGALAKALARELRSVELDHPTPALVV